MSGHTLLVIMVIVVAAAALIIPTLEMGFRRPQLTSGFFASIAVIVIGSLLSLGSALI